MAKDDRKRLTRARILDAAFEQFARHGFADTSIDMIARRARVAHGTVFSHFGHKPHVFAAAALVAGERFLDTFRHHDASFLDTAAGWIRHLRSDAPIARLLRSLDGDHRHGAVEAAAEAVNGLFVEFWRAWIDNHPRRHVGSLAEAEGVAHVIVAALTGLATIKTHEPDSAVRALFALAELIDHA